MEGISKHPLVAWREGLGIKQADAATRLGLNEPTLSRYENYKRTPTLTQAAKLSEKTGIPIDKFVLPAEAAE